MLKQNKQDIDHFTVGVVVVVVGVGVVESHRFVVFL